jgi:hypothetical protein
VAVVAVAALAGQLILQGIWKYFLPEEFRRIKNELEVKVEALSTKVEAKE